VNVKEKRLFVLLVMLGMVLGSIVCGRAAATIVPGAETVEINFFYGADLSGDDGPEIEYRYASGTWSRTEYDANYDLLSFADLGPGSLVVDDIYLAGGLPVYHADWYNTSEPTETWKALGGGTYATLGEWIQAYGEESGGSYSEAAVPTLTDGAYALASAVENAFDHGATAGLTILAFLVALVFVFRGIYRRMGVVAS